MKKIFFFLGIFLCTYCFGQKWSIIKIDSNLSIKLPSYDRLIDTSYDVSGVLKIRTIVAFTDSGRIVFTKGPYPKNAEPISEEKTLLDFYDGVKQGLVNTVNGEVITDSLIELNNLKIQKLCISLNYQGEPHVLYYLGFLLNQNKYSLQVLESASKAAKLGRDITDLLVFLGDLSFKQQLTQ